MYQLAREREAIPELVATAASLYSDRRPTSSEVKGNAVDSYDLVTDADEEVQKAIVDGLSEMFPDDLVIAEEGKEADLTDGRTWVVDPIDGTLNYERGTPIFGTQLALMVGRKPVFSFIRLPALGEDYLADDTGAYLNGRLLKQSASRPLKECIVSTGDFSRRKEVWREKHGELIELMRDEVARIRMMGAACSDFAFLAAGRTDIHIRFVNKLWDFVPGMFLAEMSGAYYDRDLLEQTRLLVMCGSKAESDEFAEKILSGIDIPSFPMRRGPRRPVQGSVLNRYVSRR